MIALASSMELELSLYRAIVHFLSTDALHCLAVPGKHKHSAHSKGAVMLLQTHEQLYAYIDRQL